MIHRLALLSLLLWSLPSMAGADDLRPVAHALDVRLTPESHRLEATDALTLAGDGTTLALHLNRRLTVRAMTSSGGAVRWTSAPAKDWPGVARLQVTLPAGARQLTIRYDGTLRQDVRGTRFSRQQTSRGIVATIGPEGTYLSPSGAWYPMGEGLARYTLRISTPMDVEAVAEGARSDRVATKAGEHVTFTSEMPLDGVHCIAGPYVVVERKVGDVALYAYVYKADEALAGPYLDDVARYLALYGKRLGPYPFRKFAVVESFFPSGYGMPSFTYLGQQVMRLPFIRKTSLGHEVAHNWWGNGVLVDAATGNWCEGLTTYYADYLYEQQRSAAAGKAYRRRVLADYTSYTRTSNDLALAAFRSRHDFATRAVGYGKSLMVFHMLAARFGTETFDAAMRDVVASRMGKVTGWRHLLAAVEARAGVDLGWFADQWIARPGAPVLRLSDVELDAAGDGLARLRFALAADRPWRLHLPVVVRYPSGKTVRRVVDGTLGPQSRKIDWLIPGTERPTELAVDPEHDVMRRLDASEVPVTLRLAFGAEGLTIVRPAGDDALSAAYAKLATGLAGRLRAKVVEAGDALPDGPLVVLGGPHATRLLASAGERVAVAGDGYTLDGTTVKADGLLVVALRRKTGVALVVAGQSADAVAKAGHKLIHYGRYGALLFDAGTNVAKGVLDAPGSPLVHRFGPPKVKVDPPKFGAGWTVTPAALAGADGVRARLGGDAKAGQLAAALRGEARVELRRGDRAARVSVWLSAWEDPISSAAFVEAFGQRQAGARTWAKPTDARLWRGPRGLGYVGWKRDRALVIEGADGESLRELVAAAGFELPDGADTDARVGGHRVHRRVLNNGLVVLLVPDDDAKTVTLAIAVDAGTRHESRATAGLAHLTEHALYTGSANVGPEEHDRKVKAMKAHPNAYTRADYVMIYDYRIPADRLDEVLALEADRMRGLTFPEAAFEHERRRLLDEERRTYKGDYVARSTFEALAFLHHPYGVGMPTDGPHTRAGGLSLDAVKQFYQSRYGPNRSVLLVAGALDVDVALEQIQARFGGIPRRPETAGGAVPEPPIAGDRRATLTADIAGDRLMIGYHAPAYDHPDRPATGVLARLLSRRLSGSKLRAGAWSEPRRDPHLLVLSARPPRDAVAAAEQELQRTLAEVAMGTVDRAALAAARTAEAGRFASLKLMARPYMSLAAPLAIHALLGSHRYVAAYPWRVAEVTAADVARVAKGLLAGGRVVVHVKGTRKPPSTGILGMTLAMGSHALVVRSVAPGSPAAAAGLKPGDQLLRAAGRILISADSLRRVVKALPAGRALELKIRRDGKVQVIRVARGKAKSPHGS